MGTEWEDDTGKDKSGKTYAIGTRSSARYTRVYNKAAEQGVQGFGHALKLSLDAVQLSR